MYYIDILLGHLHQLCITSLHPCSILHGFHSLMQPSQSISELFYSASLTHLVISDEHLVVILLKLLHLKMKKGT